MRTIKFKLLTQQHLETIAITTPLFTFGDLKTHILNSDITDKINFNNVKFFERTTKAEYGAFDDAILPTGNLLFFVTPTKTDSGVDEAIRILSLSEITKMTYNELRTYISKLNKTTDTQINLQGTRSDIITRYAHWIQLGSTDNNKETIEENPDEKSDDIVKLLTHSLSLIEKAIKLYSELPKPEEYAIDGVTIKELEKEATQLKDQLKKLPGWYKLD